MTTHTEWRTDHRIPWWARYEVRCFAPTGRDWHTAWSVTAVGARSATRRYNHNATAPISGSEYRYARIQRAAS